jgi:hypothetical protein
MFITHILLLLIRLAHTSPVPLAHLEKRWDEITRPDKTTIKSSTDPFSLSISCSASKSVCTTVESVALESLEILSRSMLLRETIKIDFFYESFCETYGNCPVDGQISLGSSSPTAFHTFEAEFANEMKLDPLYAYPVGLARQYAPDSILPEFDIRMRLNSDVNWTFGVKGTGKTYSFSQIFTHETLHGLGFISSWSQWIPDMLLPGIKLSI